MHSSDKRMCHSINYIVATGLFLRKGSSTYIHTYRNQIFKCLWKGESNSQVLDENNDKFTLHGKYYPKHDAREKYTAGNMLSVDLNSKHIVRNTTI